MICFILFILYIFMICFIYDLFYYFIYFIFIKSAREAPPGVLWPTNGTSGVPSGYLRAIAGEPFETLGRSTGDFYQFVDALERHRKTDDSSKRHKIYNIKESIDLVAPKVQILVKKSKFWNACFQWFCCIFENGKSVL